MHTPANTHTVRSNHFQLSAVKTQFFSRLIPTFPALPYMCNAYKSALSGCYFISKFSIWLHSRPTFFYATPDLLFTEASRRIPPQVISNTLSFHSPHAFLHFFSPPLSFFFCSLSLRLSLSLSKLAFLDES